MTEAGEFAIRVECLICEDSWFEDGQQAHLIEYQIEDHEHRLVDVRHEEET